MQKYKYVGLAAVVALPSGRSVELQPNQEIQLLPNEAESLVDHPDFLLQLAPAVDHNDNETPDPETKAE